MIVEKVFKQVLGERIREKRLEKKLTIEKLAGRAEVDPSHLGRVERGEKAPGSFTLSKIQIVLGLNSDSFLKEFQD